LRCLQFIVINIFFCIFFIFAETLKYILHGTGLDDVELVG